jgi:hypothetical protein
MLENLKMLYLNGKKLADVVDNLLGCHWELNKSMVLQINITVIYIKENLYILCSVWFVYQA